MKTLTKDIITAYETIKKQRGAFGIFQKSCFHIHTPSSYDYKLTKAWPGEKYATATEDEVYSLCVSQSVYL